MSPTTQESLAETLSRHYQSVALPCVPGPVLTAFARGQILSHDDVATIQRHLQRCQPCTVQVDHARSRSSKTHSGSSLFAGPEWQTASGEVRTDPKTAPELDDQELRDLHLPARVQTLHPWKWLGRLGGGGFGEVYLAINRLDEQTVAVKLIRGAESGLANELIGDRWPEERVRRESLITRIPDHPHLLKVEDPVFVDTHMLFVMPIVMGEDSEHYCRSAGGQVEPLTALGWMLQSIAAMQHAEKHGLVHRDIKPHNIMIDQSHQIKILDYGLAKLMGDPSQLTSSNMAMTGTISYMAPEQALQFGEATSHSDQYSLGCTFYRWLVGHPPFYDQMDHPSALALMAAHRGHVPTPAWQLREQVGRRISDLIDQMLAKNVQDRFETFGQLAGELEQIASELLGFKSERAVSQTPADLPAKGASRNPPTLIPPPLVDTRRSELPDADTVSENSRSGSSRRPRRRGRRSRKRTSSWSIGWVVLIVAVAAIGLTGACLLFNHEIPAQANLDAAGQLSPTPPDRRTPRSTSSPSPNNSAARQPAPAVQAATPKDPADIAGQPAKLVGSWETVSGNIFMWPKKVLFNADGSNNLAVGSWQHRIDAYGKLRISALGMEHPTHTYDLDFQGNDLLTLSQNGKTTLVLRRLATPQPSGTQSTNPPAPQSSPGGMF